MFENFPDILSVQDLMSALDIGRNKAYELLNKKTIKSLRIGSKIRIPKFALIEYVVNNCNG